MLLGASSTAGQPRGAIWPVCLEQYGGSIAPGAPKQHTKAVKTMLIAAFIFVISAVAMIQFAVFSWRAGLVQAVSLGPSYKLLKQSSFDDLLAYQKLCPELAINPPSKIRSVRLYHGLLKAVSEFTAVVMGSEVDWSSREMVLCTQYVAMTLSKRMIRNQALLAEVRSY